METRKQKKRSSDVNVLYRVDPKRLSIDLCYTSTAAKHLGMQATNFENFILSKVEMKLEVPEQIGQLPTFVDGVFYCKTEEEAQDFIKKQIGM